MDLPPLAWPVKDEGDVFYILDETKLPDQTVYIKAGTYLEAAGAIAGMQTRAFGQVLTLFHAFLITARQNSGEKPDMVLPRIRKVAWVLEQSRPTFAFKDLSSRVISWAEQARAEGRDISSFLEERILGFLDHLKGLRIKRAGSAASLLHDGDVILTHCNVSGEMVLIGRACRQEGKTVRFYATETRPYFQGRLTAWELAGDGFDVTMVPDNAVAHLLSEKQCRLVMVGSDRVALNGDIVNKVGTFQLAVVARTFGVPFYALVQEPGTVERGEDIPIEERDEKELLTYRGRRVYPEEGIGGADPEDILVLRSLSDAQRLKELKSKVQKGIFLGAGLVSLQTLQLCLRGKVDIPLWSSPIESSLRHLIEKGLKWLKDI